MSQVDRIDRLVKLQVKLFEKAHETPMELKPLGLAIKRQGVDRSKLYCNPDFMLLPWKDCRYLSRLSDEQLAIVTSIFFATAYSEIATSETVALRYNLMASEMAFPLYSDPYMVLFQETAEEFDHIITFRALCQGLIGRGDVIGVSHFPHLRPVYDTFERSQGRLCNNGFGAMYLLMRYVLNLALKQLEGFMCANLGSRGDPLALEIVDGHSQDEARHLTTSLELGLGLFHIAKPESREMISGVLRITIYSLIDNRFCSDLSRVWHYKPALAVLENALKRPELSELPPFEDLQKSWKASGATIAASTEYENSRRWIAQQVRRLVEGMDLKLTPHGEAFERFIDYAYGAGGVSAALGQARTVSPRESAVVA